MASFLPNFSVYRGLVTMTATGQTTIGTTEIPGSTEDSNNRFYPLLVIASIAAVPTGLTTLPIYNVGFAGPNYDEYRTADGLPAGVLSLGEYYIRTVKDDSPSCGDATALVVNVTTAAVIAGGSLKLKFLILGITDLIS